MARETRARPRHADVESDIATESGAAIDEASESAEIPSGGSVDGDFNGAPELAGLADTHRWEGGDVLDAMQGREADARLAADEATAEEALEDLLADRRALLIERLDEARELGLGELFESVAEATEPHGGAGAQVADVDELRSRLVRIDAAIEEIELRIADVDGDVD